MSEIGQLRASGRFEFSGCKLLCKTKGIKFQGFLMSFDLTAEEWKELRAEVLGLVEETRKLEKLALGASGAVYAWLATHVTATDNYGFLPWFIPVLFVAFCALRCWSLSQHIGVAAGYLKELESELESKLGKVRSDNLGWEVHFNKHRGPTY